jgi:hypothetical protein
LGLCEIARIIFRPEGDYSLWQEKRMPDVVQTITHTMTPATQRRDINREKINVVMTTLSK